MQNVKFLMALVMFACGLLSLPAPAARVIGDWEQIYEGIWYATGSDTSPRLMKAYAIKVELKNPNVSFKTTPDNGADPLETTRATTPAFLDESGLKVAINANFFDSSGIYADVRGLLVSDGVLVSPHESSTFNANLRINAAKTASVSIYSPPPGIQWAVAGDTLILYNGQPTGSTYSPEPRTTLGISKDGNYLIMVVVDGRQPGYSQGATVLEMAYWQLDFGGWNAINLDGGGSSTMVRSGDGGSIVLNSPSDDPPRSVGANFGVYSVDLESPCKDFVGDANSDGFVDMDDFAVFQRCLTIDLESAEPLSEECFCFDFTEDGTIDAEDLDIFVNCAAGPGVPVDPDCRMPDQPTS